MIFITVGTHEQQFDRLLIEMDRLIEKGLIQEEVYAQRGYSNYVPSRYNSQILLSYDEMELYFRNAEIIITHGGPSSIMYPLQYGKIPIVAPRRAEFGEHVDNHQVLFTRLMEAKDKIIALYDISDLGGIIKEYDQNILRLTTHEVSEVMNKRTLFCKELRNMCSDLLR
jgi:UDP-N-acetylglucosamine transferase subunit ALG13